MLALALTALLLSALLSAGVDGAASCWPPGLVKQSEMPFCRLMDKNFALHWSIDHKAITMGVYVLGANKASEMESAMHASLSL